DKCRHLLLAVTNRRIGCSGCCARPALRKQEWWRIWDCAHCPAPGALAQPLRTTPQISRTQLSGNLIQDRILLHTANSQDVVSFSQKSPQFRQARRVVFELLEPLWSYDCHYGPGKATQAPVRSFSLSLTIYVFSASRVSHGDQWSIETVTVVYPFVFD